MKQADEHQQSAEATASRQAEAGSTEEKMPPLLDAEAASRSGGGSAPKASPKPLEGELSQELEQIREKRKLNRRPGHFKSRHSKLFKYHAQIMELRRLGASLEDIRLWLRKRRMKVQRSTIYRYLQKESDNAQPQL